MWEKIKQNQTKVIFIAILLAHTFISFYGVIFHHYRIAPGDDSIVHLQMLESLKQSPVLWPNLGYPPGFHYLIWGLSAFFGASPNSVLAIIWPMFIVLSGLSVYLLARKIIDAKYALLAYFLFVFVCPQPLQTAFDGGWPNIIASDCLIPLGLVFLIGFWKKFNWRDAVLFVVTSLAIIYTHHFSTIVWLIIAATSCLVVSLIFSLKESGARRFLVPMAVLLGLTGLFLVYENTIFFSSAKLLLQSNVHGRISAGWIGDDYLKNLSGLIYQLSLVGAVWAFYVTVKNKLAIKNIGLVVLLIYYSVYFFGSRLPIVAEPTRLARDLVIPAVILAVASLKWLFERLKFDRFMRMLLIAFLTLSVILPLYQKIKSQVTYNLMIRFSEADIATLNYINDSDGPFPFLVLDKTDAWEQVASKGIIEGKIEVFNGVAAESSVRSRECVVAGYYKDDVWREDLRDKSTYNGLVSDPRLSNRMIAEDESKAWYEFCPL